MKETQATTPSFMLSFEPQLWVTVNASCGSMDAAGYKHAVLLLILLKYISDAFQGTSEQEENNEPFEIRWFYWWRSYASSKAKPFRTSGPLEEV